MGRPFGQHFLRNPQVVQDVLGAAAVWPGERILEIGPGRGVLTDPLADAVGPDGRVVAVEADPDMAQPLFGRWPNVDVVLKDVMKADLARLGPFDAVVANLPYQISGPVTAALLDLLEAQGWGRAVLMYQREFGDRLLAGPGSKAYGKLSVQAQRLCRVERVRNVAPGCFDPPPKVDSVVLHFEPLERPLFDADTWRLRTVLDAAFGQRRKQLHNTLFRLVPRQELERLGAATLRPEQVPVADWGPIVAAADGSKFAAVAAGDGGDCLMQFDGLTITTHSEVYKPHDDTFLLASAVEAQVRPGMRFLEVGCGAGVVAIAAARAGARATATDANPYAVELARHNARQNDVVVEVTEADLFGDLAGPFDMVAFNPPYLPTGPEDKVSGPLNLAFDGGADGNETVLRFADQLLRLDPLPGVVLIVHSDLSDPSPLQERLAQAGYEHEVVTRLKLWFEELWVRRFYR